MSKTRIHWSACEYIPRLNTLILKSLDLHCKKAHQEILDKSNSVSILTEFNSEVGQYALMCRVGWVLNFSHQVVVEQLTTTALFLPMVRTTIATIAQNLETVALLQDHTNLRQCSVGKILLQKEASVAEVLEVPAPIVAMQANSTPERKLSLRAFRQFRPLLEVAEAYAQRSGGRFIAEDFKEECADSCCESLSNSSLKEAAKAQRAETVLEAAGAVKDFACRVREGDASLIEEFERAFHWMM
eukprot:1817125-Amphidinium_carterae.2